MPGCSVERDQSPKFQSRCAHNCAVFWVNKSLAQYRSFLWESSSRTSPRPPSASLVEVDGEYHARFAARDARRDRALRRAGWRVLRLDAALVMGDLEVAVGRVREVLS